MDKVKTLVELDSEQLETLIMSLNYAIFYTTQEYICYYGELKQYLISQLTSIRENKITFRLTYDHVNIIIIALDYVNETELSDFFKLIKDSNLFTESNEANIYLTKEEVDTVIPAIRVGASQLPQTAERKANWLRLWGYLESKIGFSGC